MNLRLFVSGILVGCAIGLLVGGALVDVPAGGDGERHYPFGVSLLLVIVGMAGAMSVWRAAKSAPAAEANTPPGPVQP